ncbi:hypothetical protein QBC38DRAFT_548454 [Podospora fimiseda]|uniref:DNAJC9 HTH domain-containing protein n=1 Tax=Podospora fimiseda TaxID=252190 RepID=A0AAN7BHR2_9PEZI|nr:hypothetical protein QBC38DRAFT_548454 [Podospora fimiseda]
MRTTRSSARNAAAGKRDNLSKAEQTTSSGSGLSPIARYFGNDGPPRRFIRRTGSVKSLSSISSVPDSESDHDDSDVDMFDDADDNPSSSSSSLDATAETKCEDVLATVEAFLNRSSPVPGSGVANYLKPDPDVGSPISADVVTALDHRHEEPCTPMAASSPIRDADETKVDPIVARTPDDIARRSSSPELGDGDTPVLFSTNPTTNLVPHEVQGQNDNQILPSPSDSSATRASSITSAVEVSATEATKEEPPSEVEETTVTGAKQYSPAPDIDFMPDRITSPKISTPLTPIRIEHSSSPVGSPILGYSTADEDAEMQDSIRLEQDDDDWHMRDDVEMPDPLGNSDEKYSPASSPEALTGDVEMEDAVPEDLTPQALDEDTCPQTLITTEILEDTAVIPSIEQDGTEEPISELPVSSNDQPIERSCSPQPRNEMEIVDALDSSAVQADVDEMIPNGENASNELIEDNLEVTSLGTRSPNWNTDSHNCQTAGRSRSEPVQLTTSRLKNTPISPPLERAQSSGPKYCFEERPTALQTDTTEISMATGPVQLPTSQDTDPQPQHKTTDPCMATGVMQPATSPDTDPQPQHEFLEINTPEVPEKPRSEHYARAIFVPMDNIPDMTSGNNLADRDNRDDGPPQSSSLPNTPSSQQQQQQPEAPPTPASEIITPPLLLDINNTPVNDSQDEPESPLSDLDPETARELEREILKNEEKSEPVPKRQPFKTFGDNETILDEIVVCTDLSHLAKPETVQKPRSQRGKKRTESQIEVKRPIPSSSESSVRTSSRQRKQPTRLVMEMPSPPRKRRRVSMSAEMIVASAIFNSSNATSEQNLESNNHGMSLRQRNSGPYKNSERERAAIVWLYNHYHGDMKSIRNELPGSWGRGAEEKERLLRILGEVEQEGGIKLTPAHSEKARRLVGFS